MFCPMLLGSVSVLPLVALSAWVSLLAPALPPPLSAEEAVQTAVRNNRRLAGALRDSVAASEGVRAAGALANPVILFTPSLSGGVGGGSDTEVLIQQPLEVNGIRRARRGVAGAQARRIQAEAIVELRTTAFAARVAYYELVRAREQSALSRTLLETAKELDRIARRQVELGARPAIEQTQTNIEVTRAEQQVFLTEAAVTAAEVALNIVMNRSSDTTIGMVALRPSPENPLPDFQAAYQKALTERTEIQAGLASVDAFRQEARLANAEGVPDIVPQFRAGSITRGVQQSGFGIGITLPLLDYGSRRGRVRQAEEASRAEAERTEATRLLVQQEVAQALARARGAKAILNTFPQGLLEDATRLLRASRIGYEEGKTSVVQLVEAQRTYRQVQSEHINAQVNYALALAEVERVTGAFSLALFLSNAGKFPESNP